MIDHLINNGIHALETGAFADASRHFEMASIVAPDDYRPPFMLAITAQQQNRPGLAIPLLRHAAALGEKKGLEYPAIWNNLGIAYRNIGMDERAMQAYDRAVALAPDLLDARINRTGLWINAAEPERCIAECDAILADAPDNARTLTHKALALLEAGRYAEGWALYDARFGIPGWHRRGYDCPMWDGQPVDTLAIHPEQGLGDEVLFGAWINEAKQRARRVVIECAPRLEALFRRSFGCDVYGTDEALRASERPQAWIAMGSLPRVLGAVPKFPGAPYIVPDPALVAHYRRRLEALGSGPYVGLTWSGGTFATHAHLRSPPMREIRRLLDAPATFIALQYGESGQAAGKLGIAHWPEAIADLDHQAALIKACDRVVTVCQTVVHLAGAMGVPCWVMTPHKAAWRYGLTGSTVPWYGSVTLFRQAADGDWSGVIDGVLEAMQARAAA